MLTRITVGHPRREKEEEQAVHFFTKSTIDKPGLTLYRPANDPRTGNDPQVGPQMIPGREMIPKLDSKLSRSDLVASTIIIEWNGLGNLDIVFKLYIVHFFFL